MRRLTSLLVVICVGSSLFAKDLPELAASRIDGKLLVNANAVIRDYRMETKIKSLKLVLVNIDYVITILNPEGQKYSQLEFYYSDFQKLDDCHVTIYDKNGKLIKKSNKSDFSSIPATIQPGYYGDGRINTYSAASTQYPYTIHVSAQLDCPQTFSLPDFRPQFDEGCAVANAVYTLSAVHDIPLRYKSINMDVSPDSKGDGMYISYRWELKNINAHHKEPYTKPGRDKLPVIYAATQIFRIGKYEGHNESWKEHGRFMNELNKDRDVLPAGIEAEVRKIIGGVTDQKKKIELLYKYLQGNTRYVAIEYGIGGFQTLDAAFVAKNQYGDCKALSNYMMALLKAVGVRSYPVLIRAGSEEWEPMLTDFPSDQFNHVILCVPCEKDTVWLECTSQDLPANYLGNFTQDRDALMVTAEGGFLVHTPAYDTADNKVIHHVQASCKADNSLAMSLHNQYCGLPAYGLFHRTDKQSNHEVEKYVNSKFGLASYSVSKFHFDRQDHSRGMAMNEQVELVSNNMIANAGDYSIINVDLVPLVLPPYMDNQERTLDFYIPESVMIVDSFEITLNENMVCEHLPQTVSYTKPFGAYFCNVTLAGNKLLVFRRFALHHGSFKPELFKDYMAWLDDVRRDATKKIMTKTKG